MPSRPGSDQPRWHQSGKVHIAIRPRVPRGRRAVQKKSQQPQFGAHRLDFNKRDIIHRLIFPGKLYDFDLSSPRCRIAEDIDYHHPRGLQRETMLELVSRRRPTRNIRYVSVVEIHCHRIVQVQV